MNTSDVERFDVARVRATLALSGIGADQMDDAVQAVRVKVHQREQDNATEPLRDVTSWAVVVASRVAVDLHRSGARQESLVRRLQSVWQPAPDVSESQVATAVDVARALSSLSSLKRQVLLLRYYEDLTVPTIAEVLGVPIGTVKSRLHDAEQAVRTQFKGEGEGR
jgi:RNA polymerase sigma-70 factor (ECF subfamily)